MSLKRQRCAELSVVHNTHHSLCPPLPLSPFNMSEPARPRSDVYLLPPSTKIRWFESFAKICQHERDYWIGEIPYTGPPIQVPNLCATQYKAFNICKEAKTYEIPKDHPRFDELTARLVGISTIESLLRTHLSTMYSSD